MMRHPGTSNLGALVPNLSAQILTDKGTKYCYGSLVINESGWRATRLGEYFWRAKWNAVARREEWKNTPFSLSYPLFSCQSLPLAETNQRAAITKTQSVKDSLWWLRADEQHGKWTREKHVGWPMRLLSKAKEECGSQINSCLHFFQNRVTTCSF